MSKTIEDLKVCDYRGAFTYILSKTVLTNEQEYYCLVCSRCKWRVVCKILNLQAARRDAILSKPVDPPTCSKRGCTIFILTNGFQCADCGKEIFDKRLWRR